MLPARLRMPQRDVATAALLDARVPAGAPVWLTAADARVVFTPAQLREALAQEQAAPVGLLLSDPRPLRELQEATYVTEGEIMGEAAGDARGACYKRTLLYAGFERVDALPPASDDDAAAGYARSVLVFETAPEERMPARGAARPRGWRTAVVVGVTVFERPPPRAAALERPAAAAAAVSEDAMWLAVHTPALRVVMHV